MHYLLVGLLTALLTVFGVSAFGKVRGAGARRAFTASLRAWRVVPDRLVGAVAALVTAAEIVIVAGAAIALVTMAAGGAWRLPVLLTLAVAAGLLVALSIGIMLALRKGTPATCACFGATERPLNAGHLVRDIVLVLAVAVGLAVALGPAGTLAPGGALLGAGAGAIAGLLVARLDDLIDLFAPGPASGHGR